MARPRVAIVIPALNEATTVGRVVAGVRGAGTVIVIDDGSSDATGEAAAAEGALVLRHEKPRGYERALESGFAHAARLGYSHVVTMDADGQHLPATVEGFVARLGAGYELVVGVRPHAARISEALFGIYTRVVYGVNDPLCGMKGYSLRLYAELGHFDSYRSVGTELMLYGLRRHCRVAEVWVPIAARRGKSGFGGAVRGNWRILRALVLCTLGAGRPGRDPIA